MDLKQEYIWSILNGGFEFEKDIYFSMLLDIF